MTTGMARLPLPTYDQLFNGGSSAHGSGTDSRNPVHIRTGSDPPNHPQNPRLLRVTHSSIGFTENCTGKRNLRNGLPVSGGSVRKGNSMRSAHERGLRMHSSLGLADACFLGEINGRRPVDRIMTNPPQKPARKFPPILENVKGKYYGSNGYLAGGISGRKNDVSGKDPIRTGNGRFSGLFSSSLNFGPSNGDMPDIQGSCLSLGQPDETTPFHTSTPRNPPHHRHLVSRRCMSRQPSVSTESLPPLPAVPDEPINGPYLVGGGSRPAQPLRPGSAAALTNMPATGTSTGQPARIHTNGSLQHLLLMQAHQLRQTPTYDDLLVMQPVNGESVHADLIDSVSVNSVNSESDSGKATSSQNSGDAQQEETMLLMEECNFSGLAQHGKNGSHTWKMLPEMGQLPWTETDIAAVLQKPHFPCLPTNSPHYPDLIPHLSHHLRYPFLRICHEITRLTTSNHTRATKRDVLFAAQRVLPFALFRTAKIACIQSSAFYSSSTSQDQTKTAKSSHSALKLDVGKIHGWLVEKKVAKFVHDLSAVYLAAILESLLEEVVLACGRWNLSVERSCFEDADLYGLFRGCRQLMGARNGGGKVVWPRGLPVRDLTAVMGCGFRAMEDLRVAVEKGCLVMEDWRKEMGRPGSELGIGQMHWASDALVALHYFLGPDTTVLDCVDKDTTTAPLIEWLRVIEACAAYRRSSVCEKDDVMEAARILLAGVEYPPSLLSLNDELQYFQAISKPRLLNDFNQAGLTPLMIACIRGDIQHIRGLLSSNAKVNLAVPPSVSPNKPAYSRIPSDIHHWTALHFAVAHESLLVVKCLLDSGAWVEGSEQPESVICETPLQLAAACGMDDIVGHLLAKGADPLLSGVVEKTGAGNGDGQRRTQSALVLAAAHGRRRIVSRILARIFSSTSTESKSPSSDEAVSLEEILQEDPGKARPRQNGLSLDNRTTVPTGRNSVNGLSREHVRLLQTALYHAAENGFLDVVAELSYYAVPWRAHIWIRTISLLTASHLAFINDILAGYWSLSPQDLLASPNFLPTALPCLFDLLTICQNTRPLLFHLFKILSSLYGRDPVPPIQLSSTVARKTHFRLNDQTTADVVFRVDGVFVYAHRDVVMGSSRVFQELLSGTDRRGPPVDVFNASLGHFLTVMEFLYEGGWQRLNVAPGDVVELMSTAHYFQLPGLMRYCESVWSRMVSVDNALSTIQHAKLFLADDLMIFSYGILLQNAVQLAELDWTLFLKFLFSDDHNLARLQGVLRNRLLNRHTTLERSHVI